MAYKMKPKKAVLTRFKVTKTGKLKHRHTHNSHLNSGRNGEQRRRAGRPGVLYEGQARRLRRFALVEARRPAQAAHEAALAEKKD